MGKSGEEIRRGGTSAVPLTIDALVFCRLRSEEAAAAVGVREELG
jgi:hypothetical protein